jgi:hypothetical protein
MNTYFGRFLAGLSVAVLLASCGSSVGNGMVKVELTDAPGDYEEVNVKLGAVQAHYKGDGGDSRWITLVADGGSHDLLELQNDVTAVLGEKELAAGDYTELRMIIKTANVLVDGVRHDLDVPSGAQTGLKFPHNFRVEDGKTYRLVIDFDAAKSIKKLGQMDEYLLEPVIIVKSFIEL